MWGVFELGQHVVLGGAERGERNITYPPMELLEGETLAARRRRGRMTADEALPLIQQMVAGLEAAHAAGVVHRDFKPSNVMLCDGREPNPHTRVVITDFGLARGFSKVDVSASLTHSGQLIGTLAYMAPEQAEGKAITPATDIYALGLVMYEMVTGERPFPGEGPFAGVIERTHQLSPSPRTLVPDLDSRWEFAILRCLETRPEQRFQRPGEIVDALLGKESGKGPSVGRSPGQGARVRKALQSAVLIMLLIIGAIVWSQRGLLFSGKSLKAKLEMTKLTADGGVTFQPSMSSDGKRIVYSSDRDGSGKLNLWVQALADGTTKQITHEFADAIEPDFSPDGKNIAFRAEGDGCIYIISSDGGEKRRVVANGHQPKFSPDGNQVLYWSGDWLGDFSNPTFVPTGKIYIVPAAGGPATRLQSEYADARLPVWLPDGKHMLFLAAQAATGSFMDVADWWIADLRNPGSPPVRTHTFELIRKDSIVAQDFAPQWFRDSIIFSGRLAESTNLFRVHIAQNDFQAEGPAERLTFGAAYETTPSGSSMGKLLFTSANASINIWSVPLRSGGAAKGKAV